MQKQENSTYLKAITIRDISDVHSIKEDIKKNMISISSPIARALIGKEEGDVAEVQTPGGLRSLEIVEIKYI